MSTTLWGVYRDDEFTGDGWFASARDARAAAEALYAKSGVEAIRWEVRGGLHYLMHGDWPQPWRATGITLRPAGSGPGTVWSTE